jgi:hypothetical protein
MEELFLPLSLLAVPFHCNKLSDLHREFLVGEVAVSMVWVERVDVLG